MNTRAHTHAHTKSRVQMQGSWIMQLESGQTEQSLIWTGDGVKATHEEMTRTLIRHLFNF